MKNSKQYDEFVDKFKPRHTTDDCFTPPNVYAVVLDWAAKKYGFDKAKVVRPFCPGGDYQAFDYAPDAVVVDNPPFSIISKIVKWYNDKGVRFFLFCPSLTAFRIIKDKRSTYICTDSSIKYDNGVIVKTGFVTNMGGDVLIETCNDLRMLLRLVDKRTDRESFNYVYPKEVLTAGITHKFVRNITPFVVTKQNAEFLEELEHSRHLGGLFILSERAAAERAAAERAAAERAAAHVLTLSPREKELQKSIGK